MVSGRTIAESSCAAITPHHIVAEAEVETGPRRGSEADVSRVVRVLVQGQIQRRNIPRAHILLERECPYGPKPSVPPTRQLM
jgi:hypothetical protein